MVNRLAPLRIGVDDATITLFQKLQLGSDGFCGAKKGRKNPHGLRLKIIQGGIMLLGNEQDMNRGLRVDIPEGDHFVVLEEQVAGDFSFYDFAEEAVGHGF
jgi:hypothetical protein